MEKSKQIITELYNKYQNDQNILNKLTNYIEVTLPTLLESYQQNHNNREEKNKKIKENNEIFIKKYINMNAYNLYYSQNS